MGGGTSLLRKQLELREQRTRHLRNGQEPSVGTCLMRDQWAHQAKVSNAVMRSFQNKLILKVEEQWNFLTYQGGDEGSGSEAGKEKMKSQRPSMWTT